MTEPLDLSSFLGFLVLLIISFTSLFFAKKKAFFELPKKEIDPELSWVHVISFLCGVLVLVFVVLPLAILLLKWFFPKVMTEVPMNLPSLIVIFWVLIYIWLFPRITSTILFGHQKPTISNQARSAKMGFVAFLLAYPASLIVATVISWITWLIFGKHSVDQVAVDYLKSTAKNLSHFIFTFFLVTFVVPFFEEFFFRGLLQNWLKKFTSQLVAISLTSLIFAVVHFSKQQGIGNIELICTLFFLALFLGFIYEKERQLIAPYIFHGAYNAVNAILVYIGVITDSF